ncbi:MAG: aminoglycoside phosphotransferase family protein [Aeromicrobium sp.]
MADGRRAVLKASPDRAPGVRGRRTQLLSYGSHAHGDRARRATRGASDRGDRAWHTARGLLDLPRHRACHRAPWCPARERCSRPVLSNGRTAYRLPVRLLGETLRTSSRAYGADTTGPLAQRASPSVLLHGDLTPSNILDGGAERGLVAIDPAPCLGDAAFDASRPDPLASG